MANVKITDLTALSGGDVASNDVLPIVDINVDQTKKIAISDLITATSAANDFITFTQLNANLNVLDANADAIEARRVANVTVMTDEDTALQSRLATNVTAFTAEDTALQVRINANSLSAASNDFITFTRLNANINVVNQNVNSGVGLIQRVNSAVSTGSSNVFFVAVPSASQHPSDLNKIEVYIDGIRQRPDSLTGSNHDFVYNSAAASVTVTDPSLPSGLIVIIDALCPPA